MKKVINGKMYDTETAKLVGNWDNGGRGNDFNKCEESLYQKRTGEFFLYGEGGPMSKYAKSCGNNSWGWGSEIIPLTFEAAKEWSEEFLSGDDYEKIFGQIIEDDSKRIISLSVTVTTHEKLKRMASEQNLSIGEIVDSLIK